MPQKSSKKKKSAQKKQGSPRYVVPPYSRISTCSMVADVNVNNSATPIEQPLPTVDDSSSIRSVVSQEVKGLEARWDARMALMEDNMRSTLLARPLAIVPDPSPPPVIAPAAPAAQVLPTVTPAVVAAPAPAAVAQGRASRGLSTTSRSSSSSSGSSARSSSGHGSSHSRRRHRRSHRSRSRSRDRSADGNRRRKHGKYTVLKYLPEFSQVSSYERLVLANVRMSLKFYKNDRDIAGMLEHIILVAEKAETGYFEHDALIRYDESVKQAAYENGLSHFEKLNPAAIVKHLSYDGTKAAANSKRASGKRFNVGGKVQSSGSNSTPGSGPCYKFNFASGGCRRSKCDYRHVCSACFRPGHVNNDCTNVDRSGSGSQK